MNINKTDFNLKVIATPIGNLNEVSPRVKEALNDAYVILCEDTRNTKKLLNLLGIIDYKKLISFHDFNENEKINQALEYIKKYNTVLVSDAGYPTISDPGYQLIKECHRQAVGVTVINGPCAAIHGLVASGFCSTSFMFLGFLGKTQKQRLNRLNEFKDIKTTFIIYEAVHRIKKTLDDIMSVFGDVFVFVGRELTKLNESHYLGRISDIPVMTELGEFVIVVDHNQIFQNDEDDDAGLQVLSELEEQKKQGIKLKEACKIVGEKYNIKANELYKLMLEKNK
ncbi:16S rRNA (cytidine(1402)-2'-O)-methyltransferase [Ureaplasma canigenitalium]|uniref:16S rRNA (cytidine(1402)-2'-O)-methyltransferase n=1 Tax=Ureaplasma canigenitalium TaxID=42092 RepID=UPI0004E15B44|nr:16S rRNA (cytidine(1402)-2'-O)-methyltransferase [Ureaplasma canigenitalium]